MTLETICQIFSGNTETARATRNAEVLVADKDGLPRFKVVDVTLTTTGKIVLLVASI